MDEGIIERCEDAGDAENELACLFAVQVPVSHLALPLLSLLLKLSKFERRGKFGTFTDLRTERNILFLALNLLSFGSHFD